MKDAHVYLMKKLTRDRPGDMENYELRLNKIPIFGIQVAGKY
jgi:hypothetical protein